MEVGLCYIPQDAPTAARLARLAEEAGIGWFGVADSQRLYGPLYPSIQLALDATSTIRVGSFVTNPVTQHWSVHAATNRAFEQLHPGRSFLGIAAGDSAVHSVGLRPAAPAEVAKTVDAVREAAGPRLPIITAVGGRRAAAAVSAQSDGVLLGTGFEPEAFCELALAADAGPSSARRRWIYLVSHLVERDDQMAETCAAIRAPVIAFSRQALSARMEEKHVPPELIPGLRRMYDQYVFSEHAKLGSYNADLLAAHPAEEAYLFSRFAMVATPESAAERISAFRAQVGDFGLFLGTRVPDPEAHIRLVGRLAARMSEPK